MENKTKVLIIVAGLLIPVIIVHSVFWAGGGEYVKGEEVAFILIASYIMAGCGVGMATCFIKE